MRRLLILALLIVSPLWAEPPTLDIPPEVRPSGQYVTLLPKTEAKAITYVGLSGIEPIPSYVLRDARMFLLDTRGLAAGRYRFAAIGTLDDEQGRTDFSVVIGNAPPTPNPNPNPEPDPGPAPDGVAGKIAGWAKDAGISKGDLAIIGDNYLSVGSQGSDPARSTGWDLSAFTSKTKELNLQNVGVDKIASWNEKFFRPLATWQAETFKSRNLTTKDREKIAALWTETGTAIKAAAR